MPKPISDRWIEERIKMFKTIWSYGKSLDKGAILALRELQRLRRVIRMHYETHGALSPEDRTLYRATLPEGEK